MATVLQDTFTGAADTALLDHAPDIGSAWTAPDASAWFSYNPSGGPKLDGAGLLVYDSDWQAVTPDQVISDVCSVTTTLDFSDVMDVGNGGFGYSSAIQHLGHSLDIPTLGTPDAQSGEVVQCYGIATDYGATWGWKLSFVYYSYVAGSLVDFLSIDDNALPDLITGDQPAVAAPFSCALKVEFTAIEAIVYVDDVELGRVTRTVSVPTSEAVGSTLWRPALRSFGAFPLLRIDELVIDGSEEATHRHVHASISLSGGSALIAAVRRTVEQELVIEDFGVEEGEVVLDGSFLAELEQEVVLAYHLLELVEQEIVLDSEILDVDVIEQEVVVLYPILSGEPVQITAAPTAVIRGQVVPLESASVAIDEEQSAWVCELSLVDPLHHGLFGPDDVFTVNLPGEDYAFIVDSKSFDRRGQVDRSAVVSGISPSARFAAPRAKKISRTWGSAVLVTDAVEELFGTGVVDWQVLNWSIPAFRLGVESQTPMDVLQRLAQAPGAVVDCEPNGGLRVRYAFPVAVPQYASAAPDQEYFDAEHNFSVSERGVTPQLVNRLRILDVQPGAARDSIEFEQDKVRFTRGRLRVFPQPWREEVRVEHTSDARVSATAIGVETEELTETVEVIAGKGSVSKPIYQVVSLEWLFRNLTGVAFETDAREFSTTHPTEKESLLVITYRTRFVAFKAAAFRDAEVQFLVKEAV